MIRKANVIKKPIPEWKLNELKRVVDVILNACCDVPMILLYGSYARGTWKTEADLKPDRKSGHVSDYDILVVTGSSRTAHDTTLWQDTEAECRGMGLSARPQFLVRDINFLNNRLSEGQYFFYGHH